mmetsp:Transcript_28207/g.47941  ORF Transcript_28207/g.47941 Transcript_28207/m.47941 type:complete len:157 (+) Transcript_28207:344-814(+)
MLIDYVKGERSVLNNNAGSVEKAWEGYSICNEAIMDPNNAWVEAQSLVSSQLDPGLSKSQVLFWVSTREGFSPSTTVEVVPSNNINSDLDEDDTTGSDAVPDQPTEPQNSSGAPAKPIKGGTKSLASCTSHEKCVAENLLGSCCPTNQGVFLRCCT